MRGGDREAEFREYLLADRTRLMRTALLLTAGDVHTAEDLVQTACTRVYVHWHRIKHEGAGPYAHRILVNAFLDERRRAGRHPEVVTAETLEPRLTDEADPVDTLAVRGALLDLAPRQRAVLVLRYFQDLDVASLRADPGVHRGHREEPDGEGVEASEGTDDRGNGSDDGE